jgi:hypothetical protein
MTTYEKCTHSALGPPIPVNIKTTPDKYPHRLTWLEAHAHIHIFLDLFATKAERGRSEADPCFDNFSALSQFFVLLLIILLAEVTIAILLFVYEQKVSYENMTSSLIAEKGNTQWRS